MIGKKRDLNTEYPPADEPADIREMAKLIQALHHPQGDGRVLRAQHAKDTGCVQARMTIEPNLPADYRHGVFGGAGPYDLTIRFSNASENAEGDRKGTPRGMAIKIARLEGERVIEGDGQAGQDFLLVDNPTFIFRAVKDYLALFALRHRLKSDLLALLAYAPLHPAQVRNLLKAKSNVPKAALIQQYWSMSPFLLGPRAIKFSVKPQAISDPALLAGSADDDDNFLFRRLAAYLKSHDAHFDFLVQFQEDADTMPIEDATVEWKVADSPFVKVATITIPAQDLEAPEMREFRASCENLSFNPWHTLADHRPLGGLNRMRRAAYEVSVARRRQGSP